MLKSINRSEEAQLAIEHVAEMERRYEEDTTKTVKESVIYGPEMPEVKKPGKTGPKQVLVEDDTVGALFKYKNGKTAILNFASYQHPGGGFLNGATAQEECLCRESNLYNVLSERVDFYEWNREHDNGHLYKNRALYSPGVIFLRGSRKERCDVITCASPNLKAAMQYGCATPEENEKALEERIAFIVNIAIENKVDTLILGAFGCGVFGQDAGMVAKLFQRYTDKMPKSSTVVYAVPRNINAANYEKFAAAFR